MKAKQLDIFASSRWTRQAATVMRHETAPTGFPAVPFKATIIKESWGYPHVKLGTLKKIERRGDYVEFAFIGDRFIGDGFNATAQVFVTEGFLPTDSLPPPPELEYRPGEDETECVKRNWAKHLMFDENAYRSCWGSLGDLAAQSGCSILFDNVEPFLQSYAERRAKLEAEQLERLQNAEREARLKDELAAFAVLIDNSRGEPATIIYGGNWPIGLEARITHLEFGHYDGDFITNIAYRERRNPDNLKSGWTGVNSMSFRRQEPVLVAARHGHGVVYWDGPKEELPAIVRRIRASGARILVDTFGEVPAA